LLAKVMTLLWGKNMKNEGYRPDIDGLRGIAVFAVIVGHFWPHIFPSAYLGVDVFFVISGYVITSSIQKYTTETLSSFLSIFYARRIKRIFPALIFCLTAVSLVSLLVIPNATTSLMTAFTAVIGLSNLFLMYSSADYFGLATEYNLFTHTWSLGVEEQFYLVYPVIFWLSISFLKTGSRRSLLAVVLILSLLSFILLSMEDAAWSYYFPLFRAWEFLIGVGVFFLRGKNAIRQHHVFLLSLLIGLMAVFLVDRSLYITTIIVVAITGLIIYFSMAGTVVFELLTSKIILWLGTRSYSIYLWHWPVLVLMKVTLGIAIGWLLLALLLTLVISEFSYNVVETKFRSLKAKPSIIYKTGFATAISALAVILVSAKPLQGELLIVKNYTGGEAVHTSLACHSGSMSECLNKDEEGDKTVFVIGDSHATNLVPSIKKSAEAHGYEFKYFGGVKFIRTIFNEPTCIDYTCIEPNINLLKQALSKIKQGDIVFFSMSRSRLYLPEYYLYEGISRHGNENRQGAELLRLALVELYEFLNSRKAKLVFVDDIPATCSLSDYLRLNVDVGSCRLDYNESIDDRAPLTEIYTNLAEGKQSLLYVDPHQGLCSKTSCEIFQKNTLLYTDTSPHISETHKHILVDVFDSFFNEESERKNKLSVKIP
jgi:peptidoglycan/LPS O-acetylase OafA/YrhL